MNLSSFFGQRSTWIRLLALAAPGAK